MRWACSRSIAWRSACCRRSGARWRWCRTLRGTTLRMQDIPAEDPAVYAMIQRADTIGVFQIESRAQQSMLPRLKPRTFYDLVIEVAIVRPGPIQGGMVHPYLKRRQGLEPVTYPSEAVRGVLERTLGVPIFQEQVMQLAIVAAGFTPGEADRLRRSMAAWKRKGGLQIFEQRLVDGMGARGYDEAFARQIYQQILGFGEYGFPESHSASFALLVYVSSWLKHYEPAAFCGALLNSQPMGFYAPAQLVGDARRHGVDVRPPDVTISDWDCALEAAACGAPVDDGVSADAPGKPALRLGLRLVGGLTQAGAARIVAARNVRAFASVPDLAHRAQARPARPRSTRRRRCAGASLAGHRHEAVWDVAGIERMPRAARGRRVRRSAADAAGADGRPGHRRRLSPPRTDAAPSSAGAAAPSVARATARDRRRDPARAARTARANGRHRHRPPAARYGERRRVRDDRGRNRRDRTSSSGATSAIASAASCWARDSSASTARSSAKAPSCTCWPVASST